EVPRRRGQVVLDGVAGAAEERAEVELQVAAERVAGAGVRAEEVDRHLEAGGADEERQVHARERAGGRADRAAGGRARERDGVGEVAAERAGDAEEVADPTEVGREAAVAAVADQVEPVVAARGEELDPEARADRRRTVL